MAGQGLRKMAEHLALEIVGGFVEGLRGKRGLGVEDGEAFAVAEGEDGGENPGAAVEGDIGPLGILGEEEDGIVNDFGLVVKVGVKAYAGDEGFGEMGGEEVGNEGTANADDGDG